MLKQRLSSLFILIPVLGAFQRPAPAPQARKSPATPHRPMVVLYTEQSTPAPPHTTWVIPVQYTPTSPTQPGQPPLIVSKPGSRNLLYTPEDAARFKVVHPFLTPEIQGQVKIIPVRTPVTSPR